LQNPELRAEYEEGARRYAEANSWASVAEKHIDLYDELL
jgi:glycosyltransferase involved in cell wall biosynthesis